MGGRSLRAAVDREIPCLSQVEEREKTLAGLERMTSDLNTQRKKAQKDVSGCPPLANWAGGG